VLMRSGAKLLVVCPKFCEFNFSRDVENLSPTLERGFEFFP